MSKLRKTFTISIMVMTVLSMSVVVAPQAEAAASAGDLIKMSGLSSIYYLAADGKRYVFPNEQTYFSWYSDFSSVVTISQSELEGYPLGKNVTIRPGTKLVKITTDPKVYAVEPNGTLKWVPDETTANTLYGANWAKRVIDVPDSFFTNYTVSDAQVIGSAYPTGSLVKWSSSSDVYYIASDGKARKVASEAAFTVNRFNWNDVISAPDTVSMPTAGSDISSSEEDLIDTSSGAGGTIGAGTGLSVALASDTPASATVVSDSSNTTDGAQSMIPVLRLNFTAASDGAVKVKTINLKRGGISADTDVVNMYLYDGDTRLATNPSISEKIFTFSNAAGLFTVPAGTTKPVDVKMDVKNNASAGITIKFSVESASDITTDGATTSGSFPMSSNTFTTATVTDLGLFTLSNVSPTAASTVNAGSTSYEIWRFTAAASAQDIELRQLLMTMVGSINIGDVKNFSLWDGGTQISSTVVDMNSDNEVFFDLSASPYTFAKGTTKTLSLKADVISGSTRTFRATIQNAGDIIIYDKGYGVFLKHNGADSFTVVQPATAGGTAVDYTINSGTLTMSVAANSPTGNIASSTTAVVLSKFKVEASGEDVKIINLVVQVTGSDTAKTISNLKVLWDGSQVGSVDTSYTLAGGDSDTFTFGSTVIARSGKTHTISVVADITGTTTATETIHADLKVGSSNYQGLSSLTTGNTSALTGRTLTIAAGTVTVIKNPSFGDKTSANPTGVSNGDNTKIASFVIVGGSGEAASVSAITLKDTDTTDYLSNYFQNVKLMHGTTQLGSTLSSPASGSSSAQSHVFSLSPSILIGAGEQYVVDVYADIKTQTSAVTASSGIVKVDSVTASGYTTGTAATYDTDVTLQNGYIATAGGVTVAVDSDTRLASNLLMGAVDQELAKFKFTASSTESINISELVVSANITSAATGTLQNIKLYDGATQVGSTVAGLNTTNASTTHAHAVFTGLNINIAKGASKVITVKSDITSYDGGGYSTTGQALQLVMMAVDYSSASGNNTSITGTGGDSGTALSFPSTIAYTSNDGTAPTSNTSSATSTQLTTNIVSARANEFVLFRAKLSIAWASDTPSGSQSPMSGAKLAKFTITNTANAGAYSATVKALNFSLSTTVSNTATTDRTLTIYKDGWSGTSLATTVFDDATMVTSVDTYTNTNILDGDMTDVEISSGASKTFYVTLDTTPAVSTKSLSVTIPEYHVSYLGATAGTGAWGIYWSDGVTTTIVAHDRILPLTTKTLTY